MWELHTSFIIEEVCRRYHDIQNMPSCIQLDHIMRMDVLGWCTQFLSINNSKWPKGAHAVLLCSSRKNTEGCDQHRLARKYVYSCVFWGCTCFTKLLCLTVIVLSFVCLVSSVIFYNLDMRFDTTCVWRCQQIVGSHCSQMSAQVDNRR